MAKKLKGMLIIFILGIMFGGMLGISIRYPVTLKTMQEVTDTCQQNTFIRFKVGITGKVYEVSCPNGKTYYLK